MEPEKTGRHLFRQLLVSLVAASSTFSSGMSLGYSAIALPELQRANSTDYLNPDQASWFASIASIATPLGCLLCGPLLDKFGRRIALLALNAPFLLGWFTLALTPSPTNVPLLYLGRVLTGLGTGMASIPGCVYIAEISDQRLRGMLVTWPSIGISVGILIVYVLGAILPDSWRLVAAICGTFPLAVGLASIFLLYESPVWLASKGRDKEAERSLTWLSKVTPEQIQIELNNMKPERTSGNKTTSRPQLASLLMPQAWKPLLILNGYFFFQQFSGIYVVVYYAVDIIRQAEVTMDAYVATVLLGVVQLVAGIAVSFALTRCGRRPMSLLSGVGMTLCMVGLAVYLQLEAKIASIPLILLVVYVVAGAIGFHTLPWAMLGEMYPAQVKGLAGGITTCLAYLFSFAALKMYPYLLIMFGTSQGVFYLYGVVSLIATVFVLLYLTETHRKTLQQIEHEFLHMP
ncbi:hypothetical protein L9F63_015882, partial [Diploptera punctata]